jgi:hypothetical protein
MAPQGCQLSTARKEDFKIIPSAYSCNARGSSLKP